MLKISACIAALMMTGIVSAAPISWLDSAVNAEYDNTVEMRHYLHQHGELGNQEYETQKYIKAFLEKQGIKTVTGFKDAPTAVIGIINEEKGDAIGLRADIDALPIKERNEIDYVSTAKGKIFGEETFVSHMCGHDAHMSMLLSAAKIMAEHKDEIDRAVVFVFQPAEEGDSLINPYTADNLPNSGAKALVEDDLIERFKIKHMFGIHVMARQDAGKILISKGATLNSIDGFKIDVEGVQAHGAMPWSGVDATLTASQIVVSMQQLISRNIDLSQGMGVITVGKLHSGEADNVMSGKAQMTGTIRSNNNEIRKVLIKRLPEIAAGVGISTGANVTTKIIESYPVTMNDPKLAENTVSLLQENNIDAEISTWNPGASEDFSFYALEVPSVFMFLGVDKPDTDNAANNHSDKFMIEDEAMKAGVKAHIVAAMQTKLN
ncbi:M20 metallopeptidase family protein [Succinatimonas hippei]|uniref:M20 metallopeptidase family protein n=1 Tax=Succinatimonas hippei TaxID=626938 RepID=UPI0023F9C884|nr:amidohydrolase [Succinatimonas hippei]